MTLLLSLVFEHPVRVEGLVGHVLRGQLGWFQLETRRQHVFFVVRGGLPYFATHTHTSCCVPRKLLLQRPAMQSG